MALTAEYEEVSFLAGAAGPSCWPFQATETGLRSAARLLRRVHDASLGWEPPVGAVWAVSPLQPFEVICHGDPGPWNMVWREGEAAGLFDWDFCHPGPRQEDVAYALEYLAPFRSDEVPARWHGFGQSPDRAGRVKVFCDEYGIETAGMTDAVIAVQRRDVDRVRTLALAGIEPQLSWVNDGYLDELWARIAWSEDHRHLFE